MDAFNLKLMKIMFQPMYFLILLVGFLYGNLFVITFSNFQWNFFLIFSLVFFLEVLNKLFYYNDQASENLSKIKFSLARLRLGPFPKIAKFYPFTNLTNSGRDKILQFWKDEKTQITAHSFEKPLRANQKSLFFCFQFFKRGFLLGFFVEAFKVGS